MPTWDKSDLTVAAKPLLRVLGGDAASPPPIWLMRQAGRYLPEYRKTRGLAGSFLDLCYAPKLATEVTLQPVRRFGLDAAILFCDILVVPDALWQKVSFEEGIGPVLEPIEGERDLAALTDGRVRAHLAPVYETVAAVAAALPPGTALIGFAGAPWTVAAYMVEGRTSRDFTAAKRWALAEPRSFDRLIDMLVEATVEHLSAQIEAGAEVVQIFDSWAGAVPDHAFERLCIAPAREIVRKLRAKHPRARIIGFPRGCGQHLADYAAATGMDAISIDYTVPAAWARDTLRCAIQGNLDPILLLAGGEGMAAEARRLVRVFDGSPYVFNLGHGVLPQTPPEHVAALVALVRGKG